MTQTQDKEPARCSHPFSIPISQFIDYYQSGAFLTCTELVRCDGWDHSYPYRPRTVNVSLLTAECLRAPCLLGPCPVLGLAAGVTVRERMQPFRHVCRANQLSGAELHVASTRSSLKQGDSL